VIYLWFDRLAKRFSHQEENRQVDPGAEPMGA
jgi:hypothetical protein